MPFPLEEHVCGAKAASYGQQKSRHYFTCRLADTSAGVVAVDFADAAYNRINACFYYEWFNDTNVIWLVALWY